MLQFLFVVSTLLRLGASYTERPIIGIMTMDLEDIFKVSYPGHDSYILASYVKAVEGSGARVVPIFTGRSEPYYRRMAKSINGLLIPGGGAEFNGTDNFFTAAKTMFNLSLEMNARNINFPVLAVCLGFEVVLHLANNENEIRKWCDINRANLPLKFSPGFQDGILLKSLPEHLVDALQTNITIINSHHWCIYPEDFNDANLGKDYKILATTDDFQGVPFISVYEHKKYPIGGVQFHPEKNSYEWGHLLDFPRSAEAIAASRYFYDWFVQEAKKNDNSFTDLRQEQQSLIYNHAPSYSDLFTNLKLNFTQTYLFKTKYMDFKCAD